MNTINRKLLLLILPFFLFFVVEIFFHGNELIFTLISLMYLLLLYITSEKKLVETKLFTLTFLLGIFIELFLTNFSRNQFWENTVFLPIPLWLPIAWGIAGIVIYRLGKIIEN